MSEGIDDDSNVDNPHIKAVYFELKSHHKPPEILYKIIDQLTPGKLKFRICTLYVYVNDCQHLAYTGHWSAEWLASGRRGDLCQNVWMPCETNFNRREGHHLPTPERRSLWIAHQLTCDDCVNINGSNLPFHVKWLCKNPHEHTVCLLSIIYQILSLQYWMLASLRFLLQPRVYLQRRRCGQLIAIPMFIPFAVHDDDTHPARWLSFIPPTLMEICSNKYTYASAHNTVMKKQWEKMLHIRKHNPSGSLQTIININTYFLY